MILLASDYDNTLNTFKLDLKVNIIYLKKFINDGNLFLLNTGREYKSIKKEIKKYNIPYSYLSCTNGNILLDNKDNLIYTTNLDEKLLNEFLKLKEKFDLDINTISFNNNILEFEIIISSLNKIFLLELNKYMIKYNMNYHVFKKNNKYHVYIYSNLITKNNPIETLKEKHNINSNNIYTIGDHINDLEMIRDYNGYAMKWAKKEVKDVSIDTCYMVLSLIKKINKRR